MIELRHISASKLQALAKAAAAHEAMATTTAKLIHGSREGFPSLTDPDFDDAQYSPQWTVCLEGVAKLKPAGLLELNAMFHFVMDPPGKRNWAAAMANAEREAPDVSALMSAARATSARLREAADLVTRYAAE